MRFIKTKLSSCFNIQYIVVSFFSLLTSPVSAQTKDSITVQLNKENFNKGDSITMEVTLHNYIKAGKTATIQLWIENIQTGKQWKFRYPLINGYVNAKLAIDSSMADGVYAFNFMLQKTFFNISGHVKNAGKKDTKVNYLMISKNKQTMLDAAELDEQHFFTVKNLLFKDSAFIVFSRPGQKKNDLLIDIKTALDSAFIPAAISTKFITVGTVNDIQKKETGKAEAAYIFKPGNTQYKIILPEVIVKTKSNVRLEQFERETTTGAFTGSDAIVLDGLSSDEIANAPDFYTYLSIKIGGLKLETDNSTGNRYFTWRGSATEMYLNEIRLDPEVPFWINPTDIAMIKVFRPGTSLAADASPGGAIAIYTKTGKYMDDNTSRRYSFFIVGYTGVETTWK